jgi:hypothetical protein
MAVNSPATSVTRLRPYQSTIVACLMFWRENCRSTIWDFCNTIGTKPTCRDVRSAVDIGRKADIARLASRRESRSNYLRDSRRVRKTDKWQTCGMHRLQPESISSEWARRSDAPSICHKLEFCLSNRVSKEFAQAIMPEGCV